MRRKRRKGDYKGWQVKEKPKASKPKLNDYPAHLRGLSQNKWGGQNTQNLKTFGGKFGPANQGRSLSKEEIDAIMRDRNG